MQGLQQSELGILVDSPWKLIAYHSLNSYGSITNAISKI